MRKKIIAGNWKMNHDYPTGLAIFSEIINMVRDEVSSEISVIIACPFIHLHSFAQLAKTYSNVYLAAQNCYQQEAGAFTGEISARMIKSVGATYVIVGHSERRQYFNEGNEILAQKVASVLRNDLQPIYCVGETLQEREMDSHFSVIEKQMNEGVFHLSEEDILKTIIAYEPVWAIGTGLTATSEQAQEMHAFIRSLLQQRYGDNVADKTPLLYGGSCNSNNSDTLFTQKDIDGGLIGGASLKARDFLNVIKSLDKAQ